VKRALFGLLCLFILGCGGQIAPEPASYCGDMPDSGNFDIYGRCVITIGNDYRVLGTISNGPQRFEIRGEMQDNGYFTGVLDGTTDYTVSGTMLSNGDDQVTLDWTIGPKADNQDHVQFSLSRC
jgi:hypothetical protein